MSTPSERAEARRIARDQRKAELEQKKAEALMRSQHLAELARTDPDAYREEVIKAQLAAQQRSVEARASLQQRKEEAAARREEAARAREARAAARKAAKGGTVRISGNVSITAGGVRIGPGGAVAVGGAPVVASPAPLAPPAPSRAVPAPSAPPATDGGAGAYDDPDGDFATVDAVAAAGGAGGAGDATAAYDGFYEDPGDDFAGDGGESADEIGTGYDGMDGYGVYEVPEEEEAAVAAKAIPTRVGGVVKGDAHQITGTFVSRGGNGALSSVTAASAAALESVPSAPPAVSYTPSGTFNDRYQEYLDMPTDTERQRFVRARRIHTIVQQFTLEATRIGRTIISERDVPNERKSIHPVNAGGIAGGEKYVVGDLFFKYVADFDGLYGGDEFAQKSAEHELKGMRAYLSTGLRDLRTPLFCLVDYRGFRLIVTSKLPLGKDSLIYGSADAGRTVYDKSPKLNTLFRAAADRLNLEGHLVGRTQKKLLHSCCDIEGHQGADGKYYVLDTARVFPPEAPTSEFAAVFIPCDHACHIQELLLTRKAYRDEIRELLRGDATEAPLSGNLSGLTLFHQNGGSGNLRLSKFLAAPTVVGGDAVIVARVERVPHLVRMLRPEFVAGWSLPLSSDAFSFFGFHNAVAHNARVRSATNHLRTVVIKNFAESLSSYTRTPASGQQLVAQLHESGINIRYLALVRTAVSPNHIMRSRILTEMIGRVAKNRLRERLRALSTDPGLRAAAAAAGGATERAYVESAVDYFNTIFGSSPQSRYFWTVDVKVHLMHQFAHYCKPDEWKVKTFVPRATVITAYAESHPMADLRVQVFKVALFAALQRQTGVRFTVAANRRFQSNPRLFEAPAPFSPADVEGIRCRVRAVSGDAELAKAVEQLCGVDTSHRIAAQLEAAPTAPDAGPQAPSPAAVLAGSGSQVWAAADQAAAASAAAAAAAAPAPAVTTKRAEGFDRDAWYGYIDLAKDVFGEGSSQVCAALLSTARHELHNGNPPQAMALADEAAAVVLNRSDVDADVEIATWTLLGTVNEALGRLRPALDAIQRALGVTEIHYGAGYAYEPEDPEDEKLFAGRTSASRASDAASRNYTQGMTRAREAWEKARRVHGASSAEFKEAGRVYRQQIQKIKKEHEIAKLRAFHGAARNKEDMRTFRAHPFATVLSDRIVALMLRMGHGQLAGQYPPAHTYGDDVRLRRNFHEKVTEYTRVLPHPSDGEVCKQFFGSEVPVGRLYTALMEVMQKNYGTPYAGEYHALPLNEALARVPAQKIERVRDQMVRQWETHSSKADHSDPTEARRAWIAQVARFFDPGAILLQNPFATLPVLDGGAPDAPRPPQGASPGVPWPDSAAQPATVHPPPAVKTVAAPTSSAPYAPGAHGAPPPGPGATAHSGSVTAPASVAVTAAAPAPYAHTSGGYGAATGAPVRPGTETPPVSVAGHPQYPGGAPQAPPPGGHAAYSQAPLQYPPAARPAAGSAAPHDPTAPAGAGGAGGAGGTPGPWAGAPPPSAGGYPRGAPGVSGAAAASGAPPAAYPSTSAGAHAPGPGHGGPPYAGGAPRGAPGFSAAYDVVGDTMSAAAVDAAGGLVVSVKGTESKKENVGENNTSTYTVYNVHVNTTFPALCGGGPGTYHVQRRYNEFKFLHQRLAQRAAAAGTPLPPLPEGGFVGFLTRNSGQTVAQRERTFDIMMRTLSGNPALRTLPELMAFLQRSARDR